MIAASAAVACVCSLALYKKLIVPGKQIVNFSSARSWHGVLTTLHDSTGQYPASLQDALDEWRVVSDDQWGADRLTDNWGYPFRYMRTADGYVLASFGSDGECDVPGLLAYTSREGTDDSPCYSAQRDTVITSTGFEQGCTK
jgi:hypothetical protein